MKGKEKIIISGCKVLKCGEVENARREVKEGDTASQYHGVKTNSGLFLISDFAPAFPR